MGQYYIIACLDKKEFIAPECFNDGAKLCEFTSGSSGMLQALAVLTCTSNGGSSSDICRTGYPSAPVPAGHPCSTELRPGERVARSWMTDRDHNHTRMADGKEHLVSVIVPAITGRWAGCRIITCGDYTDQYQFMTPEEIKQAMAYPIQQPINIYKYANCYYDNISDQAKEQLRLFGVGNCVIDIEAVADSLLSRKLLSEYPRIKVNGTRKQFRKYDMTWMDYEMFDTFMLQWDDAEDLRLVKEWVKKQKVAIWQRKLLRFYKPNKYRQFPPDIIAMLDAQFPLSPDGHRQINRLLPAPSFLNAALAVERRVAGTEDVTITTDTTLERKIATAADVRVREERVIQLQ